MNTRIAEIHRLIQANLLVPAFEEVDGEFFIYRNAEMGSKLAMVLSGNAVLTAFVTDPVPDPDKFLCDLIIYNQQRLALGLGIEYITDDKGTKEKTIVPVVATIDNALRLTSPDLYGKNADDGKTNVNIWAAELMKVEDMLATEKPAETTLVVAVE